MSNTIKITIPVGCTDLFTTSLRIVVEDAMKRYGVKGTVEIELENPILLHEAPVYGDVTLGSAARAAEAFHIPFGEEVPQFKR